MAAAMWQGDDGDGDDEDDDDDDNDDFYTMNSSPRGICVIINNKNFEGLEKRDGTDADRDALATTFERLGFLLEVHEDLDHTAMTHLMFDIARRPDHVRYDCFICCILSHGCLGEVYGSNGKSVEIKDLSNPLKPNSCPTLAGKPKMFILQACQGKTPQFGFPSLERDVVPSREELIPAESDFLLAYSTVPGFVSYRSTTTGSLFIQNLTKVLSKHSTHDILKVLTMVNKAVGRANSATDKEGMKYTYKQSPAPFYTLRKTLIFGPAVPAFYPPAEESPNVDGPSASTLVHQDSTPDCEIVNFSEDSEEFLSCESDLSFGSDTSWERCSVTNFSCDSFSSWGSLGDLEDS